MRVIFVIPELMHPHQKLKSYRVNSDESEKSCKRFRCPNALASKSQIRTFVLCFRIRIGQPPTGQYCCKVVRINENPMSELCKLSNPNTNLCTMSVRLSKPCCYVYTLVESCKRNACPEVTQSRNPKSAERQHQL
jgi:hypothetical protein